MCVASRMLCPTELTSVFKVETEKTEEEILKMTEKRKEQGKRLAEIAAAKRLEKVFASFVFNLTY